MRLGRKKRTNHYSGRRCSRTLTSLWTIWTLVWTHPSHFWISSLNFWSIESPLEKKRNCYTDSIYLSSTIFQLPTLFLVGTVFVWRKEEKDCYHASDKHRKTARCDRRASPHQRSTVTSMPGDCVPHGPAANAYLPVNKESHHF